MKRRAVSRKS